MKKVSWGFTYDFLALAEVILLFAHPCVMCVDIKLAVQSFRQGYLMWITEYLEHWELMRIDTFFFPAAAFANIRNTFGRCLPWLICHPWFLAFDCLDLLQPERRTSSDARESTGNNWKLRFRSHCGFALALHWVCIGFACFFQVWPPLQLAKPPPPPAKGSCDICDDRN